MLDAELQDNMLELHDTHHWALLIGGWVGRILKWSAQVDMVKRVAAGKYNDASVCKNWKLYYNHCTSVLHQIHRRTEYATLKHRTLQLSRVFPTCTIEATLTLASVYTTLLSITPLFRLSKFELLCSHSSDKHTTAIHFELRTATSVMTRLGIAAACPLASTRKHEKEAQHKLELAEKDLLGYRSTDV